MACRFVRGGVSAGDQPGPAGRPWNGSWTGCDAQRVHRVHSVRSGTRSVQLARLVQAGVFLVMNRSSVRFRQAAPLMLFSSIYRSRVRDVIHFMDRVVDRVACQGTRCKY